LHICYLGQKMTMGFHPAISKAYKPEIEQHARFDA